MNAWILAGLAIVVLGVIWFDWDDVFHPAGRDEPQQADEVEAIIEAFRAQIDAWGQQVARVFDEDGA